MPIIDKELVNNTPYENLKRSNVPISQFFIERVKQNIAQHGDAQWMVSTFLSFSSACNPDTLSWNIISQIPSNNNMSHLLVRYIHREIEKLQPTLVRICQDRFSFDKTRLQDR